MMNDDTFYKKVSDIVLFSSSNGYATTLSEYKERNKDGLKDKILYCTDKEKQSSYVDICKSQGYEVLFVEAVIKF